MHVRFRTDRGRWLLPAVGLVAIVLATATGSFATPGGSTAGPPNIQGEGGTLQNVDNRTGRKAPSATQRALVKTGSEARFNKFGAPGALSAPGHVPRRGPAGQRRRSRAGVPEPEQRAAGAEHG